MMALIDNKGPGIDIDLIGSEIIDKLCAFEVEQTALGREIHLHTANPARSIVEDEQPGIRCGAESLNFGQDSCTIFAGQSALPQNHNTG